MAEIQPIELIDISAPAEGVCGADGCGCGEAQAATTCGCGEAQAPAEHACACGCGEA